MGWTERSAALSPGPGGLDVRGPGRPAAANRPADGGAGIRGDDAADEQKAGDDVEDVIGDVVEDQGAADAAEEEHRGHDPAKSPLAAEDRDAPEQDGGDHSELQASPVVGSSAGEAQ